MLNLVDQGTHVRQQLNGKVVTSLDELLGFLSRADTGRGTSQDDGTGGQSGALGKEADKLRDVEDEVTVLESSLACVFGVAFILSMGNKMFTYVRGQSCMTRPLLRPRM